jgi:hypothetical protein
MARPLGPPTLSRVNAESVKRNNPRYGRGVRWLAFVEASRLIGRHVASQVASHIFAQPEEKGPVVCSHCDGAAWPCAALLALIQEHGIPACDTIGFEARSARRVASSNPQKGAR